MQFAAAALVAAQEGEGGSFWETAYPIIPHPGELIIGTICFAILVLIENAAPYGHRIGQAAGVIGLVWGVVLLVASSVVH